MGDDDVVVAALVDTLRTASALERALVAAGALWGCGPDEVADLLGMPAAHVRAAETRVRARLVEAHAGARAADELDPAPWALDGDLTAAVEHLLEGLGDPPDPTALVDDRRRTVRRRSLLAGAAAVAATGAAAWAVVGTEQPEPAAAAGGSATPSSTEPPPADDPSWRDVSSWAPRGSLAGDSGVQALVIARSSGAARLLWADDVGAHRLVVTATQAWPDAIELRLQVWRGAAGVDAASMTEIELVNPLLGQARDAIFLALPAYPGTQFVVLARPTVQRAAVSPTVRPTVEGTVRRSWEPVPVEDGIGVFEIGEEAGPALRVRCDQLDGPPSGVTQTWVDRAGRDALAGFDEETRRFVAAATGQSTDEVRTEVVTSVKVGGSVIDPDAFSPEGGDGRVVVLRTTTAGGGLVRSVRVVDDGRSSFNWLDAEPPSVFPADTPLDEPVVVRLEDARPRVGRYLVVAPGADRVQLLSTAPNAYPVSRVVRTRDGVAIVEVINADWAAAFRLVRRTASGRLVGDGVPRTGVDLLDLRPPEQTLEG